jgi:hypothetical protein
MKRRDFGRLAGVSMLAVNTARPAVASSPAPDPALLTTTLTPMGAERASNSDGSIPAWTGGLVASSLPPDQPVGVQLFSDEKPLFTVDASNMAQYQHLLTAGTQAQISKYGLSMNVYQTHRTAAAPQYVYENTAKNVTRAEFDSRGGRFGFTGAVAGAPFPIIDTANPQIGGAQLIWNHLTAWDGFSIVSRFDPGSVVINGKPVLVNGTLSRTIYPYYDPDVTPETFDGYYSKGHYYSQAPGSVNGQEILVWHSTNINRNPDIVWELLNGQGRVRKAPDEAYDTPSPTANGIGNIDESSCFYGNPSQYNWTYIAKQEMLVPYNCNTMSLAPLNDFLGPHFPNPSNVRWEKHRVWVVEATLAPGQHNVNARRRFYIDEDTWIALLGEGYDAQDTLVKAYAVYNNCIPSLPGTIEFATATFSLLTGDYAINGNVSAPPHAGGQFVVSQPDADFEAQEMAANASF